MVVTLRHQCDCTMMGLDCLLVLAAVFQVIASQEFPQGPPQGPPDGPPPGFPDHKCARPPKGVKNPQECCQIKPMYTDEELAECGIEKGAEEHKQRRGPPDCTKQECLLRKKNLLNEDNSVNYGNVRDYMDTWVGSNPEFEAPVGTAKAVCMGDEGPPGPPQICEANRLMFCTGAVLFSECPTWQDTDDCKRLKEHIDECRAPNFPKK